MQRTNNVAEMLRTRLRGRVLGPEAGEFDELRRVWNGAIDRKPCALVRCADSDDVRAALQAARDRGVGVTVRGGGHNVAGLSVRDDALLLDLGGMRDVRVDAERRIATAQGGALWRDFDAATGSAGLATTGGLISTTGIGGFTLGGGVGWLMRRYGLACDNVVAAQVVLADGSEVRVAADENPNLYWALRGGAGGFGVVTQFEFRVYPLTDVLAGLVVFPSEQAATVLRRFRDFVLEAPDEFCGLVVLTTAPPFPFVESTWHGSPVCIVALCWSGEISAGERTIEPLRHAGSAVGEAIARMPYPQWQQMLDPSAPPGRHHYWKSVNFTRLTDAVIDKLASAAMRSPTPITELHVQHLGGAVARAPSADTAFAHRDARFFVNLIGAAPERAQFESMRAWIRALYGELSVDASGGRMPNFADQDDQDMIARFGEQNARRLRDLRHQCDPDGLFASRRHGARRDGDS